LLGGIIGIIVAFLFKGIIENDEEATASPWQDESTEEEYYFPRDTFDMTKEERKRAEWEAQQEWLGHQDRLSESD